MRIPQLSFLEYAQISSIYEDDSGNLWLGSDMGLHQIASGQDKLLNSFRNRPELKGSISSDFIKVIFESDDGSLWIGTDSGLNMLEKNTSQFITYKSDPLNLYGLSNNTIHSIFEDASGIHVGWHRKWVE